MTRTLCLLFVFALSHGTILGKDFRVYSPSPKENTLWIVKAIPEGESLKLEVAEKVESAGEFAAKVDVEKAKATVENDAAQIEAEKCAVIAEEVSAKQVSVQADLDAAEPLVDQALAALDTLNKKDLGEAKSLKKPPAGVDDITAVILILLQNNPKDKSYTIQALKFLSLIDVEHGTEV